MSHSPHPKRSNLAGILVLALVIVLLAGALLVRLVGTDGATLETGAGAQAGETTTDESRSAQSLPREGYTAPDFTLEGLDGQPVSLSDWRGRPVLINFWATWCGPCEVEMPTIQAAFQAHQGEGFVVLAVAVDDSAQNVRRFFEKYELTLQPLLDDGTASRAYQVFGLPTSYFLAGDGEIVAVHTGLLTERKIEEYLARALIQE
jgi:cytochrome c biogenesis protein CcmG/thiol:disulfide interchange protein DsbE